jgi:hypothetical protein
MPKALALTSVQKPLARRLGSALVFQWDALPDALQDLLLDQAAFGVCDTFKPPLEATETKCFLL